MLSHRDSAQSLIPIISERSAQELAKFAKQYSNEIQAEDQDLVLLKNVANIVYRKGRHKDAIWILDAILQQTPNDYEILNLKGLALYDRRTRSDLLEAEKIFDALVVQRPATALIWHNSALIKTHLAKFDEAVSRIEEAIKYEFWKDSPDMLDFDDFFPLRENKPDEFERLKNKVKKLLNEQ